MGLDLTLKAIPNKASFIIDKARQNIYYATDIDKVHNTNELRQHLKMAQANPDEKAFESSLAELIKDSEFLTSLYPNGKYEDYVFFSETRGYCTIKYLLQQYLQNNRQSECFDRNIFFGGFDIDFAKQHTQLKYIDKITVGKLSEFLNTLEFERLSFYYDYEKMSNVVYKLTRPENLDALKEEFKKLQSFYFSAKTLEAFVIAQVD